MGMIDVVILVIIGIFGIKGLIKGLVTEAFGILGLILGYYAAYNFSGPLVNMFEKTGASEQVSMALGYVSSFLVTYLVVVLLGVLIAKIFKDVKFSWLNRGGGFVIGVLKSAVIMGLIISTVIVLVPEKMKFRDDLQESMVAGSLVRLTPAVFDFFNKFKDVKKENPFSLDSFKNSIKVDPDEILSPENLQDAKDGISEKLEGLEGENLKNEIESLSDEELDKLLNESQ